MKKKNEDGFTLVELLAVLVILGVLFGIAVPRIKATVQAAKSRACEANLQLIEQAIERYGMDHLDSNTGEPDYSDLTGWKDLIPAYLDIKHKNDQDEPLCPVNGEAYELDLEGERKVTCTHDSTGDEEP